MVIKKRISLDFLGEDYKEAYLVFRGIGLKEFEDYIKKGNELDQDSGAGSFKLLSDTLASHFISGEVPNEKGELAEVFKNEISELDIDTALKVFQLLTGQELDPKPMT